MQAIPFDVIANLMVKNEAPVIEKTLDNFKFIKFWLITDTGSTDKTIIKIKKWFRRHPENRYKMFKRPFVDFATNRNQLLFESCKIYSRYVMVVDAGDDCENIEKLDDILKEDFDIAYLNCVVPQKAGDDKNTLQGRIFKNYAYPQLFYRYKVHENVVPQPGWILKRYADEQDFKIIHDYSKDTSSVARLKRDINLLKTELNRVDYDQHDKKHLHQHLCKTLTTLRMKEEFDAEMLELIKTMAIKTVPIEEIKDYKKVSLNDLHKTSI